MIGRSRSAADHSLVRLVVGGINAMRRHYIGSTLLLMLLGHCYGLVQVPLIVSQEIERFIRATRLGNDEKPIDLTKCSSEPEEEMTTLEFVREAGYPIEEHFVTTEDGYILALHRIPGSIGRDGSKAPTVLLHHALMESSFCWVISGVGRGLAFILADEGYDVWMANVRGNTYSRNHTTLLPSEPAFWNFSWHEMGKYDVPAEIEYITKLKNDDSLMYIGHSMGTTMFYVMAIERPDIASKVKAMFSLAPVAFNDHVKGPFWIFGVALRQAQKLNNFEGMSEFFPQSSYFKFAAKCICNRPILRDICRNIVFSTVGFNSEQFNTTWLPMIITHTPAGTSLKTLLHFSQGMRSRPFKQFDYGVKKNLVIYGSEEPPEYDISKIQVPIALFWAENDYLSQAKDVRRLYEKLPRKIGMYRIEDPKFNHLDYLWGRDAPELVYLRVIGLMKEYQNSNDSLT